MNLFILFLFLLLSSSGILAVDPHEPNALRVFAAGGGISMLTVVAFQFHRLRRPKRSRGDELYEDINKQFASSYTSTATVFETPTAVTTVYSRPATNGAAITANGCTTPLTTFLPVTFALNGSIINVERIVGYRPLPDDLGTVKNSSVNCTVSSTNATSSTVVNGTIPNSNVINKAIIMANFETPKGYIRTGVSIGFEFMRPGLVYIRTLMQTVCFEVSKLFKKVHKGFLKNMWESLINRIPTTPAQAISTLLNMSSIFLLALTARKMIEALSKAIKQGTGLKLWSFSVTVFWITTNFLKTAIPAVGKGLLLSLRLAWILVTLPKAVILQEARRRELARQSRGTQTEENALPVDRQSRFPTYTVAATSPDLPVVVAPEPAVEDAVDDDEALVEPPLDTTIEEHTPEPMETTGPQPPPDWDRLFPWSVYHPPQFQNFSFNRRSPPAAPFYPTAARSSTPSGPDDSQPNAVPTCPVASNALETVADESPLDVIDAINARLDRLLEAAPQQETPKAVKGVEISSLFSSGQWDNVVAAGQKSSSGQSGFRLSPKPTPQFDFPETPVKPKTSSPFVESDSDSDSDSDNANGNEDINHDDNVADDDDTISDGYNFSPPPDLGPDDNASNSNSDFLNDDGDHDTPQLPSSPLAESVIDTPCRQHRQTRFAMTEDGKILEETFRFSAKQPPVARITDWADAPEDVEEDKENVPVQQQVVEEQHEPAQPEVPDVVQEQQEPVSRPWNFQKDVVSFVEQQPQDSWVPDMAEAQQEPAQPEMSDVVEEQQRSIYSRRSWGPEPSSRRSRGRSASPRGCRYIHQVQDAVEAQHEPVSRPWNFQQDVVSFVEQQPEEPSVPDMVDAQQEPAQPEMQAVDEEQRQPVPPLFYVPRIPLQPVPSQPVPSQPVPSLAQFQQQPGTLQFQGQRQLPPFSSLGQQQLPPFSPQGQQQRISSNFGQQAPTSSVFGAQQEPIQSCGDDMVLDEAEDSMVVDDAAPDDLPADDSDMQVDSNQPTLWGHPTSEPALQDHMQPAPASIPEGGYMAADGVIELPTYAGIEAPFQPPPRPSNANAPVSFNMINGSRQVPDAVNPPPRPSNANAPVSFTMISGPRQVPDAMDQGQEVFTGTAFRQMVPNENTTMADASQNSSDAGINFGRTDHNTSVNLGQTDNTSRVNFGNNSQQHISERDDEMAELSPDAPSDQVPRDPPPVATVEKILELANDMPWHIWAGMDTTQAMETTANGRIVGNWQWMADNPGYFMFVDGRNYLEGPWGAQFLEEYGSIVMKKLLEINAGT